MNFSFSSLIFTIVAPIVTGQALPDCIDSPLIATLDGTLAVNSLSCYQLASLGLSDDKISVLCISQNLEAHCPLTCRECGYSCDDSESTFLINNAEEASCIDVGNDNSQCEMFGVSETCRDSCGHCPSELPSFYPTAAPSVTPSLVPSVSPSVAPSLVPSDVPSLYPSAAPSSTHSLVPSSVPSLYPSAAPSSTPSLVLKIEELEERLNMQEGQVNILESTVDDYEVTISNLESTVDDYEVTISNLESTVDDHEEMISNLESTVERLVTVYILNSNTQTWDDHKQNAIACGGRLADIFNDIENNEVAALPLTQSFTLIGGIQTCDNEPDGCWEWSDGTAIAYSNWQSGQPNDYGSGEDCIGVNREGFWLDTYCNYAYPAVYRLPPNFNEIPGCNIL